MCGKQFFWGGRDSAVGALVLGTVLAIMDLNSTFSLPRHFFGGTAFIS